ncbi:hypothetical protein GGR56DRAFT_635222 [Xylariaceae sp. FL0804]|nr:hypothetical protein GGR56DRAFT_635222 [Xylariaceae sp. FL0804]
MTTEATAAMAPAPATAAAEPLPVYHDNDTHHQSLPSHVVADAPTPTSHAPPCNDPCEHKPTGLHSPPDSNSAMKLDGSDSELSDLEDPTIDDFQPAPPTAPTPREEPAADEEPEEEDIGDVVPDHWSGTVPVFRPDMHQFKDFKKFMEKVDSYGMKSGIIKIIPPPEWKEKLPALDDLVKQVRVREPIKQDIMGSNGTYRQVNILHQRAYNLPQWRQLCDQSEHQPPARRGERRAQAPPKPKPATSATASSAKKRVSGGRTTRSKNKRGTAKDSTSELEERPMTPVSPKPAEDVVESVEKDPGADADEDVAPAAGGRMGGSRQARPKTQTTSARRKNARREASVRIDEEAFRDWDYRMDISDYTPERCEELERTYWKTLTYAPPLYGADVLGTLFDDSTETWNLNKLPNLLDVLGSKIPGVNTAYLYLGMWKATFAWHLEDVDLYSINYLHFGAPKQWYSISQGDARRFEAAMKSIWPTDAKACDQFLRHKAFLISPSHLLQYFNIKVNKCVSYPGEFVVTYPYGYHSGYNLGYNCAEAVNFALDSWLPMGKIAKKCECAQAQDSVWIDVYEVERKLRGEETDYEETEDEDEEEEEEEDDDMDTGMQTPRSTHTIKLKVPRGQKRKRARADKGEKKTKKIRLRVKSQIEPPCCLCPHDIASQALLPTDDGRKAHRICALYNAETWIENVDGKEVVANAANVSKARLDLKCLFCRSKRGACFQCSHRKCARAYHATCAAAAGVFVEEAEVPVFGEDGTEYKEQAFEFSCRFHRAKRDRKLDGDALESCPKIERAASALKTGDICQLQYYRGDIFGGMVVENRVDEQMFLVDVLPNGDRLEVEWKWLRLPDPADLHLQHASPNAIPMPTSRKAKEHINATKRQTEELPRAHMPFVEGFTWAEFNHLDDCANKAQAKVDFSKENQVWHYLGRNSTDARAQYTEDPRKRKHNPKSNFLDSIPKPAPPAVPHPRKTYATTFPVQPSGAPKSEKPYQYKPREPVRPLYTPSPFTSQQFTPKPFTPKPSPYTAQQFAPTLSPYHLFPQTPQGTSNTPSQRVHQPAVPKPYPDYKFQQTQQLQGSQQRQPANQVPASHQSYPAQKAWSAQHAYPAHQTNSARPAHPIYQTQQTPEPRQTPQAHQISQSHHAPQHHLPQPRQTSQPQWTPQAQFTPQAHQIQSTLQAHQQAQHMHHAVPKAASFTPQHAASASAPVPAPTPAPTQQRPAKPTTVPKPASQSSGHSRNKSSVSSLNSRTFGSEQRFGTPPASYGPARYDANNKSPFSHGFMQPRGLGPAPSPQNGSLFQAQARARSSSSVSNKSLNTPMTSSAIRPSSTASAQALAGQLQSVILPDSGREARPSIIQKYTFFQVNHNRDSTKYKTPYAPWGGFTNGYEGNLRAHLLKSPDALLRIKRPSVGANIGVTPGSSSARRQSFGYMPPIHGAISQAPQSVASVLPPPSTGTPTPAYISQGSHAATAPSSAALPSVATRPAQCSQASETGGKSWNMGSDPGAPLHPAIRAHFAAMLQQRNAEAQRLVKTEHPKPSMGENPSCAPNNISQAAQTGPTFVKTPAASGAQAPVRAVAPARPLSTTPIPRPSLQASPTPHAALQKNTTGSNCSTASKVPSVPPRQSYVPPPRPWEQFQRTQAPVQQTTPARQSMSQPSGFFGAAIGGAEPSPPHTPLKPLTNVPQLSRHLPSPGLQPNKSTYSSAASVQQPQSASVQLPPIATIPQAQLSGSRPASAPLNSKQQLQPGPLPAPEMRSVATAPHPWATPDLPEVSDGSMELVESIIRNAQAASGFFGSTGSSY